MIMSLEMLRSTHRNAKTENEVECEIGGLGCRPHSPFLSNGEVRDLEETRVEPTYQVSALSITAIVLGGVVVCLGIVAMITLIILHRRNKSNPEAPTKSRSMCVEEGILYKDDTCSKDVPRTQSLETLPAPITPTCEAKVKKTTKNCEDKKSFKRKETKHADKTEKNTTYKDINFSPGQTGSGAKLFTAFTEAAFFGQLEQLETFADLCGTTVDGALARLPSNRASAQALSGLMTELDGEGYTALHRAIQGSSIEVIRWLLKNKADPRVLSRNGETPLHIAVLHQNIQTCEILLATEASKDIHTKDFRHGHTPLDIAKACEIGNIVELLKVASEML